MDDTDDTIIVNCKNCGKEIEKVTFVPGRQKVVCSHCASTTFVLITEDLKEVYVSRFEL